MLIIKKAFRVWHQGMLSDNPYEGYRIDDIPVVYANSPGEAKSVAKEPYDWTINGDEPKFTDLKVQRAPDMDIVLFDENGMQRRQVDELLKQRKRTEERKKAVERFPDGTNFFIQNGYVGNSVLWWAKNSNGYTTDMQKAELFTKQEVLDRFVSGRKEDIIWESEHVLSNMRTHVDGQYLSPEFKA
jgi:hypothetical protein